MYLAQSVKHKKMASALFLIVGLRGEPLYELDTSSGAKSDDVQHLNQFVAHSALDLIDYAAFTTVSTSLKCVDRFQDKFVSAFLTPGGCKFMLIHEGRSEDSIKLFFDGVHELYVKLLLNPFTEHDTPITSASFDKRVRALAKRI